VAGVTREQRRMMRAALGRAWETAHDVPTLAQVALALEAEAVSRWGDGARGAHVAPWERGLEKIGLGTMGDVRRVLREWWA
jgi:hypothetical protein